MSRICCVWINYNTIGRVWAAGSTNYQPILTGSSSGVLNIQFAYNNSLTGSIFWIFAKIMI